MNRTLCYLTILLLSGLILQPASAQQEPESTPLLTVRGLVLNADGSLASDGLLVEVTIPDRGLMQFDVTGSIAGPGAYAVALFSISADGSAITVAQTGDSLEVRVRNQNDQKMLGSRLYTLESGDIQAKTVTIDIQLDAPFEPTPLPGYHLFVIRGAITVDDGQTQAPVNGVTVEVENIGRGLSQQAISGAYQADGIYVATFADFVDPVIDLDDTWHVRALDSEGGTIAETSATVTQKDLLTGFINLDLMLPAEPSGTAIMAIRGTVFTSDGVTPAADGLQVTVTNTTKGLSQTDITGAIAGKGGYVVTFVDLNQPVAEAGDTISVQVASNGDILGKATAVLTASDILASTRIVDVRLTQTSTRQGTSLFLVRGTVHGTPDGATSVDGLEVKVTNLDKGISLIAPVGGQAGEGQYVVTFFDLDDWVAEVSDTFRATVLDPITDQELGNQQVQIQPADIAVGYLTLDVDIQPAITVPGWDTNADGIVDIGDLVVVGLYFGTTLDQPVTPNPDVNGDQVVDISDLVLVGLHFGEQTSNLAAPGLVATHTMSLERAIAQIQQRADMPLSVHRAMYQLVAWLGSATPTETKLLLNYPNPFNPETWIPFQLASASEITISIYDQHGYLVRQLDLGYRQAGHYFSKDAAIHWDGTNQYGESLASGMYYCTLRAGETAFTRRMLLLK